MKQTADDAENMENRVKIADVEAKQNCTDCITDTTQKQENCSRYGQHPKCRRSN